MSEDLKWHQVTVMERCDVLRAGQQRIERAIDRIQANKATLDWAAGIDRWVANLLERVVEDETREQAHHQEILSLCERVTALEECEVDALTVEPGWSVSEAELAWLRRVEETARAVLDAGIHSVMTREHPRWDPALTALYNVFDSEPVR